MAMMTDAHTVQREIRGEAAKGPSLSPDRSALDHATRVVHRVCCLAGPADFIDEVRTDNRAVRTAIKKHDTPALFDWLVAGLSYQGVSDRVAAGYMDQHGRVSWHEIESALASNPSCPKLQSYWNFHGCGYHKTSRTCSEPDHIDHVRCRPTTCATAASTRLLIRCTCSSATLPATTWSTGSKDS